MNRRIIISLLGVAMLALFGSPSLRAGTVSYTFTGQCSDCSGTGTAIMVLNNYTLGTALDVSNFQSFNYLGTNLLSAFSVTTIQSLSGTISNDLPNAENVVVVGDAFQSQFSSGTSGNWCVSSTGGCLFDQGLTSTWSVTPSGVPEPAGFTLMFAGVAGLALLQRRRILAPVARNR